jgi:rRNA maturation RNase YbeY
MAISYASEGISKPVLNYTIISKWLKSVIKNSGNRIGELTYIFCDDDYLKDINIKYLSHDYFTDIISFDYSEGSIISGDFFISLDRVKDNSQIYGNSVEEELLRVIIHGLLHLLGSNDTNEEEMEIMRKRESECILMYKDILNGYFV